MAVKNTISDAALNELNLFILKHIEPDKNPSSITKKGYDWFYEYFSFIEEVKIREQLAQSFYQARYVHKLLVALRLSDREMYPFILLELFEYASIFEALTDYVIEKKYKESEDFQSLCTVTELVKSASFNHKNGQLFFKKSDTETEELIFAHYKIKKLQLRDIRFSDRIDYLSKKIVLSKSDLENIKKIYDGRNHIHLLKAAADDFMPNPKETAKAFRIVRRFIESVRTNFS